MSAFDQISTHDFSLIPKSEVPRSAFRMRHSHKTAFDSGLLIPIYCEEVVPGDQYRGVMHAIARLATPITPFMDDLTLESFFFFCPNRLVYDNWVKLMGERRNPADSISYIVPKITSPEGGYAVSSIFDYFGLPTAGQMTAPNKITHNVLPLRMANLIYNEWFRDQNLINSLPVSTDDGPDDLADYSLQRRGKRHDYFTSCLPWPQKGDAPTLSMGGSAPVSFTGALATHMHNIPFSGAPTASAISASGGTGTVTLHNNSGNSGQINTSSTVSGLGTLAATADLSAATAQTINAIRTAFQIQRLLERDARGGTRYTEIIKSHFGVISPDMRLQRPEYIGGGSTPIVVNAVPQTSSTDATTPQANLAATGTMITQGGHDFRYAATEHGYIIGFISVRGENTYQQGTRRHWFNETRYDFLWPAFTHLGEQAVLNREIYTTGLASDTQVFGYQERYGHMRYHPSLVTGLMRSTAALTIDKWHLAQKFTALPTLNKTFIEENPPISRVSAVPAPLGKEFLFDSLFEVNAVRPLPMYGVPGLVDHF